MVLEHSINAQDNNTSGRFLKHIVPNHLSLIYVPQKLVGLSSEILGAVIWVCC